MRRWSRICKKKRLCSCPECHAQRASLFVAMYTQHKSYNTTSAGVSRSTFGCKSQQQAHHFSSACFAISVNSVNFSHQPMRLALHNEHSKDMANPGCAKDPPFATHVALQLVACGAVHSPTSPWRHQ